MLLRDRAIARDSSLIFAGMVVSITGGIAFQSFLAARVGTADIADAYYLGVAAATLLATVTLGTASNAFMRHVVEHPDLFALSRRGPASRVLLTALVASALMATAGAMMTLLGSGLTADAGALVLGTAAVPELAAVAGLGAVTSFARGRIIRGTWGGAINGLALLGSTVLLGANGLSVADLAIAVDVGYVAQVAVVCPVLLERRRVVSVPSDVAAAAVRAFLALAAAACIYKSQPLVERVAGSFVGDGVPAALGYADKITGALVLVAAFGFSAAALPGMARAVASGTRDDASARLAATLSATAVTTAAVIAFAVVSADDVVELLYRRGAFGSSAAATTASLILFALPTVAFGAFAGPFASMAYAAGAVNSVLRIGLFGFLFGLIGTVSLAAALGARGIVLGTGCGAVASFIAYAVRVSSFLPGWDWGRYIRRNGMRLTATAGAAGVAAAVARPLTGGGGSAPAVLASMLVGRFAIIFMAVLLVTTLVETRLRASVVEA